MRRKLFSVTSSTRRKLFSNDKVTRRRLFSNDECDCKSSDNQKIPPRTSEDKVIKCSDCGKTYRYDGSDLHLICSRCGGDRFEFVENITNPDQMTQGDLNPIDRAFSATRRKLFDDQCSCEDIEVKDDQTPMPTNPSGSLTSLNPGPEKKEVTYKCPDCGHVFTSEEQYVDLINCPECGGNRARKDYVDGNEDKNELSTPLDELLSKYEGKSVDPRAIDAELHELGIYEEVGGVNGLVDKGYACPEGEEIRFSDVSSAQCRLFSKLVISVTKEFDIDPSIDKEAAMDQLAERYPGKAIMVLKRARTVAEPEVATFSDKSYLKDSGIEQDLKVAYGGENFSLKDFMSLLAEEYPDAPEDIIDLLESAKTIRVSGGKVLISK